MNLEKTARIRKESKKRGKRFYTSRDMAIIKKDEATLNSAVKRGEFERGALDYISVCGCGREGCFVHGSVPKNRKS